MPNLMNNCLRRIRKSARPNVSLSVIAEEVGVKKDYLSKIERGVLNTPSTEVLEKLFESYGCSTAMRYMLSMLHHQGGGPDDSGFEYDDSVEFTEVMPKATWLEWLNRKVRMRENMTPAHLGRNLLAQFVTQERGEQIRVLHSAPIPEGVIKGRDADIHAITPESLVRSLFDAKHWLNRDVDECERFITAIREEPGRIFVTNVPDAPMGAGVDVTFVGEIMVFLGVEPNDPHSGELPSSGLAYHHAYLHYWKFFEKPLPHEVATRYITALREQMEIVRNLKLSVFTQMGRDYREALRRSGEPVPPEILAQMEKLGIVMEPDTTPTKRGNRKK